MAGFGTLGKKWDTSWTNSDFEVCLYVPQIVHLNKQKNKTETKIK